MAAIPARAALAMGLPSSPPPPWEPAGGRPEATATHRPDELLEDARLLLLGATRHRRQLRRVLVAVVHAVTVEVGDALCVRLLLHVAAELDALLGDSRSNA